MFHKRKYRPLQLCIPNRRLVPAFLIFTVSLNSKFYCPDVLVNMRVYTVTARLDSNFSGASIPLKQKQSMTGKPLAETGVPVFLNFFYYSNFSA